MDFPPHLSIFRPRPNNVLQARIAESDSGPGWYAIRDTLNVEVDGKTVRGSATFSEYFTGTGDRAEGSFEVDC